MSDAKQCFPASLGYYGELPLMIIAALLLVLSVVTFPAPHQEVQWRLCMIGTFACLLGCSRAPLWFVINIFCFCWNIFFLALLVWGT